jgi:hypothetical protein
MHGTAVKITDICVPVTPWMELKPNCGSDRAWVYSVPADYADEEIRPELLAIRFANPESMSACNIQIYF